MDLKSIKHCCNIKQRELKEAQSKLEEKKLLLSDFESAIELLEQPVLVSSFTDVEMMDTLLCGEYQGIDTSDISIHNR